MEFISYSWNTKEMGTSHSCVGGMVGPSCKGQGCEDEGRIGRQKTLGMGQLLWNGDRI